MIATKILNDKDLQVIKQRISSARNITIAYCLIESMTLYLSRSLFNLFKIDMKGEA